MLTWCIYKFSLKMRKVAATACLIQSPPDYRQTDPTISKKTKDEGPASWETDAQPPAGSKEVRDGDVASSLGGMRTLESTNYHN